MKATEWIAIFFGLAGFLLSCLSLFRTARAERRAMQKDLNDKRKDAFDAIRAAEQEVCSAQRDFRKLREDSIAEGNQEYLETAERHIAKLEEALKAVVQAKVVVQRDPPVHPKKVNVAVLHCEFEGSRSADMLDVIDGFPFGKKFCKANLFTKALCKLISVVLAPVLAVKFVDAWFGNTPGSAGPAQQGGGTLAAGAPVIVRGSWVFDTGHHGYNEVHAVRIVQIVDSVPSDADAFKDFLARWCARLSEVRTPAAGTDGTTGSVGQPLDRRPEDQWEHHPEVDGCSPEPEPEPTEPVIH